MRIHASDGLLGHDEATCSILRIEHPATDTEPTPEEAALAIVDLGERTETGNTALGADANAVVLDIGKDTAPWLVAALTGAVLDDFEYPRTAVFTPVTGQPGQALCIFAGDMLHYKDRTLPYREVDRTATQPAHRPQPDAEAR